MNLRKEISSIVMDEEKKELNRESISLLEVIFKEKKFYDYKKSFCQEAFKYMKNELDFVTFYFKYNFNNVYDTIINLENVNKMRREVTLTYDDGIFKISSRESLTDKEKEIFEKDRDFYEKLTRFGIDNYFHRQVIDSTSKMFNITLFNEMMILSSNIGDFNLSYLYDDDELSKTGKAMDMKTKNYFLRRMLEKNDCENLVKLLENVNLYTDELPRHLHETKRKVRVK